MDTGLDAFIPEPRIVVVAGREFRLMPLTIRQLPAFARAVGPAVPLIAAGRAAEALIEHAEGLAEAVTVASGAGRDWVDGLWPDDFLDLWSAIVEVNLDFFVRRVLPRVRATGERIRDLTATALPQAGPSSSAGSAAPATGSTMSSG